MRTAEKYNTFLLVVVGAVALISLFLIATTYNPANLNRAGFASETIEFDGRQYEVRPVLAGESLAHDTVTLTLKASTNLFALVDVRGTERRVELGDTIVVDGYSVTLFSSDTARAGFIFAPVADACDRTAGQTMLCRGRSACCGGTCADLSCTGADSAFMCGNRQMYCCSGELSLTGCSQ